MRITPTFLEGVLNVPDSIVARSRIRPLVALLLLATMLLAACGGTPTQSAEADDEPAGTEAEATGTDSSTASATSGMDAVYAELEGLSGDERHERLLELAKAEEGVLSFYDSMNGEEGPAIVAAFEEATGLTVERYRASSKDVMTRVIEEAGADATASDIVAVNGVEAVILDREGLFAPLEIDVEGYPAEQVENTWAWTYINAYAPWWNTSRVAESDIPTSWEDVLSYDGRLALEVKAFDWFATVVEDYLMAEQGMSEEEAVGLFRAAAETAVLVNGYSVAGQLLASGEFDMTVGYSWIADGVAADGAPVAWQPPVEPMVARPSAVGVHSDTSRPAQALLYIEFLLDEGQEILAEYGRTPAVPTVEGGLPEGVPVLWVDLDQMLDEREKWEGLYAEVLQASDSEVLEG